MFIGFMFAQMFISISFSYYANIIFTFFMIGLLIMFLLFKKEFNS